MCAAVTTTNLTYYVQEYSYGPSATLLSAAGTGSGNLSQIGWGTFVVLDNFLKAGPNETDTLWGKVTGTGVVTTKGGPALGGLQINTQHIFNNVSGYADSSLTVLGTIAPPFEINIPGGTGAFRGFSGYGILTALTELFVPPFSVYRWDIYLRKID